MIVFHMQQRQRQLLASLVAVATFAGAAVSASLGLQM